MKAIGIASPINCYELREYLDVEDTLLIHNNSISASSVHTLIKGFIKMGHRVVVFTADVHAKKTMHLHGRLLDIYIIPRRFYGVRKFSSFDGCFMAAKLRRIIGKHISEISILHAQWTYEYAYASSFYTDMLPVFCTVRDWCPYLRTKAHTLIEKLHWYAYGKLFKKVISNQNIHFLANSSYTKSCMANYWDNNRFIPIMPNLINDKYVLKKRIYYPSKPVFVSIANFLTETRKNLYNLLLAFREYKKDNNDTSLWLVGKYSKSNDEIREWRKQGLLEKVFLLGFLNHEELINLLDKATVLVHPSLEETFGNILLEGMARRLIVIGGEDSGAVPEVLGYGKFGYLCDVTQPLSLCATLQMAMDNWNESMNRVEAASTNLLENYIDRAGALKHLSLYEYIRHDI